MIEREILGCILKDNSLIQETIIQSNYFKNVQHRLLFDSMKKLATDGKAIDKVTLLSKNYNKIDINLITDLETTGRVDNFESYEKQLIDQYKSNEAKSVTKNWLSSQNSIESLLNKLQQVDELGITDEQDKNTLLLDMAQEIHVEQDNDGVTTGLYDLDSIIGGFHQTKSYIIGARPSIGKTATMLKFMMSANAVPIVFSLEMSKDSLLRRLISTIGHINSYLTRNPHKLTDAQKKSWTKAVNDLYVKDFEIFDTPLQTIGYIRSQVRKMKRKYNKDLIVFIDYLTLIHTTDRFNSKHDEVTYISAQLKAIAKEYNCPVVTLAQLSRGVEQRQDKRPMLSDLRESGSIEQDADVVMFLYRENYYDKQASDNLEIIVAKNRDGATGTATVYYNTATGKIDDIDH